MISLDEYLKKYGEAESRNDWWGVIDDSYIRTDGFTLTDRYIADLNNRAYSESGKLEGTVFHSRGLLITQDGKITTNEVKGTVGGISDGQQSRDSSTD